MLRYSALAGLTSFAVAAIISWFALSQSSPFYEWFVYEGDDLKRMWGVLNLLPLVAGAIANGNPHDFNVPTVAVVFAIQWFLVGFVPTFLITLGYQRAAAAH